MRTRKKKWTAKELSENQQIVHEPSKWKGQWQQYFQNEFPVHLELGCGKGRFITELSLRHQNINFLGFERDPVILAAAARLARQKNGRAGFIVGEAQNLCSYFESGEIQRIYLNFSDPWPNRKKWAKRRLTYRAYLQIYQELMGSQGEIFLKTDNQELFEFSLNEFSDSGWSLRNITLNLHQKIRDNPDHPIYGQNIMTEYEEKFSEKGLPIYRCEAYYGPPSP